MKKSITIWLISLLSIALLPMTSCKKPKDGETGPQGSQGNANVKVTTFTTTNGSWTYDATDKTYIATIPVTDITSAVVSSGAVLVYLGDGSGLNYGALPFSYNTVQFLYDYELNKVNITVLLSDGSVPNNPGGQQFKVIVIAGSQMKKIDGVDTKSFSQVQNALHLLN